MIIKGDTVGSPTPRSDWAQTDSKKADFIKNKPFVLLADRVDIDTVTEPGWYTYYESNTSAHKPFAVADMFVIGSKVETACHQVAFDRSTVNSSATRMRIRRMVSGEWQSWEWVNPPMMDSTEYKTIEKWGSSPVYVKRVDVLGLPNSGTKAVAIGIPREYIFSICGTIITGTGNCYSFPYIGTSGSPVAWFRTSENGLVIHTTSDMSASNASFIIKYTKNGE